MKVAFLVFILLSVSFAENNFGPSLVEMEKTWIIGCPEPDCYVEFEGILTVNNSNHKIVSIIMEPEMNLSTDEYGEMHVLYSSMIPDGTIELNVIVTAEIDYDARLVEDPPLAPGNVTVTELTEWDGDIMRHADGIKDEDSTLMTIRNMVEWVHENVEYDIAYFNLNKDARTVFKERKGVCVEYSHLLISMLASQEIDARYVSGYVLSGDWEPHGWVEAYVPGYGWLPLDATFNQAGGLDSSHVMLSYGNDQETDFDRLTTTSGGAILDRLPTRVTLLDIEEDPEGLSVEIGFENKTYATTIDIKNSRGDYVYGLYSFYPPKGYGNKTTELLLLSPYEMREQRYEFEPSLFEEGYSYTLPLKATLNDAIDEKTVVIVKKKAPVTTQDTCYPALLLAVLGLLSVIKFADK